MDAGALVAGLRAAIEADATPERARHEKRYLKSDLEHLGAPVPHVRTVAARLARDHPEVAADPWPLVRACWDEGVYELRSCMAFFLERATVSRDDLPALEALLRDSHTWALVDPLAVQVLPRASPDPERLAAWAVDDDLWIRRAALLADLKRLRAGEGDPDAWARLAVPNLEHPEFFIRKALGWMLREVGKKRPEWTAAFVARHRDRLSALTVREGTRNLPDELREALG